MKKILTVLLCLGVAHVIFDAEGSVLLKNGLKVHAGASLEVR